MKDCQDYFASSIHLILSNTMFSKLNGTSKNQKLKSLWKSASYTHQHALPPSLPPSWGTAVPCLQSVPRGQECRGSAASSRPCLRPHLPRRGTLPRRLQPSSRGRGRAGGRPASAVLMARGRRGCSSTTGSRRLPAPTRPRETGLRPGFAPGLPPCCAPL